MRDAPVKEALPVIPAAPEGKEILADYHSTGLTLRRHPLALLRPKLTRMNLRSAVELDNCPPGRLVRTTGIVTCRQRPGSANGVMFITLEDETGIINVILWNPDHPEAAPRSTGIKAFDGTWRMAIRKRRQACDRQAAGGP